MADNVTHDSRAIANEILRIADSKQIQLTIMQLLKLVFFAHGWTLALLGRPLSSEDAQAWRYGPVFPDVYYSFPGSGSMKIFSRAKDRSGFGVEFAENFSSEELNILDAVVDGYGKMHAFELSNLTHSLGSPWDKTFKEKGVYSVIPNEEIRSYFKALGAANAS